MQSGSVELIYSCSNCRQRNKKCDGTKPVCNECIRSGLFCQGYENSHNAAPAATLASTWHPTENGYTKDLPVAMHNILSNMISSPAWLGRDSQALSPFHPHVAKCFGQNSISEGEEAHNKDGHYFTLELPGQLRLGHGYFFLPSQGSWRALTLDPRTISNTLPFIISQYVRLVKLIAFRSPPSYLQDGLTLRLKTSNITYSSMFLSAKVFQALLDNFHQTDWGVFTRRIDQFHHQIDAGSSQNPNLSEMENKLAVVMDLASLKFITADSASGYALMKHAAPLFCRIARLYPSIWTSSGAISLPHAISLPSPELSRFVWMDNLAVLVFGTKPFFCYDAVSGYINPGNGQLEWVYGCPEEFMVFLGRINALRLSCRLDQRLFTSNTWCSLATEIQEWVPFIDQSAESCTAIARLAVHECWRHSLLIYLHMGVYKVNSMDPRVVSSVQQIIQLLGTVKNEEFIDRHLFVPCLIAGISAQREKDRGLVRRRIVSLSATKIWVLQGADFTSVLDHLWHGPAKDGRSVVWEDYVVSRRAALPVDE